MQQITRSHLYIRAAETEEFEELYLGAILPAADPKVNKWKELIN